MRRFNVTGLCVPAKHYMVDISGKIDKIMELIDYGHYFTINRGRQYGKTTTLYQLEKRLADGYICASISFEGVGDESFEAPEAFCQMLLRKISRALTFSTASEEYAAEWLNNDAVSFESLGEHITKMCSIAKTAQDKTVVLMIDEVDKTSSNRVFLHFLGMLRDKFLSAQAGKDCTFQSVILAGVTDIKNLKLKMINDGICNRVETEGKIYNSPLNIAVNFNIDMSFSPAEIATMLADYEADHHFGMDIGFISEEIHKYTSGYPFLVSRICQCIDEELEKDWSENGVQEAVKKTLSEHNTLFDDMFKNFESFETMYQFLYGLLIVGESKSFALYNPDVQLAAMFGYIKQDPETKRAVVANRIFEIMMTSYFASKDANAAMIKKEVTGVLDRDIVKGGVFDMELCMRKFAEHYKEIFSENDLPFFERHGRLLFISYLKPLVNGYGFYHIESQFTDLRRMDVVVDYGRDQFIIELKLWRGETARERAYDQLLEYMDSKGVDKGYLLTFDFRKEANKESKADWVQVADGKMIFEVVV